MGLFFLNDETAPFIVDASTLINLNGTSCAGAILNAIPNRIIVMDAVVDELLMDNRSSRDDAKLLASLVAGGLVSEIEIGALKGDHFEHLVLGNTADTLDDGEAATIASSVDPQAPTTLRLREQAVTWLERALDAAVAVEANPEAVRHARAALELARPEEKARLYERLGDMLGGDLGSDAYVTAFDLYSGSGAPAGRLALASASTCSAWGRSEYWSSHSFSAAKSGWVAASFSQRWART